jgi:hypothetical protein
VVAAVYGIASVYEWGEGRDMMDEKECKNNLAMLVLREYLTEKILKIVLVG